MFGRSDEKGRRSRRTRTALSGSHSVSSSMGPLLSLIEWKIAHCVQTSDTVASATYTYIHNGLRRVASSFPSSFYPFFAVTDLVSSGTATRFLPFHAASSARFNKVIVERSLKNGFLPRRVAPSRLSTSTGAPMPNEALPSARRPLFRPRCYTLCSRWFES